MSGFAAELPGGVLAPKLTEEVFSRPFRRKAVAAVSSLSRTRDPHVAATKHICGDGAGSVDSRARAFGQPASAAESETRERSTYNNALESKKLLPVLSRAVKQLRQGAKRVPRDARLPPPSLVVVTELVACRTIFFLLRRLTRLMAFKICTNSSSTSDGVQPARTSKSDAESVPALTYVGRLFIDEPRCCDVFFDASKDASSTPRKI